MNIFLLVLATFLVAFQSETHSAYVPIHRLEKDIQSNEIHRAVESIEGLIPPKIRAEDHYAQKLEESTSGASYIVEISKSYLKLRTSGFPTQAIKLTDKEGEGIQRLSVAFVELLYESILSSKESDEEVPVPDWRETNPLIFLNNSGLYLQFLNGPEEEEVTVAETSDSDRKIIWDFLSKYAKNLLQTKLKELNVVEKAGAQLDSPLGESFQNSVQYHKFVDTLWRIMRVSVDYAKTAFKDWTTPETTTIAEPNTRLTTATIFAYEEPVPRHVFPSEEFEKRRRDIDSIYYGRGII